MHRISKEQLSKEVKAQNDRAKARAYLMQHGCGPGERESKILTSGAVAASSMIVSSASRDNTLDQVRRRKVAASASASHVVASTPLVGSATTPTISASTAEAPLPAGWKAVTDNTTNDVYYWNTETNETTWTRPSISTPTEVPTNGLPSGWKEVRHAATGQIFYQHETTGEKRWSKPQFAESKSDIPVSNLKRKSTPHNDDDAKVTSDTKRRTNDSSASLSDGLEAVFQQAAAGLDPLAPYAKGSLDPMAERMADSTASGALWQQRPYPAPGAVLQGKLKKRMTR